MKRSGSVEIDEQLLQTNMVKSYIYQMAEKGKPKPKQQKSQEQKKGIIRKLPSKEDKRKIFESVMKSPSKLTKFRLNMSNVATSAQMTCCDPTTARQIVVVCLSEFKEMIVKNMKENQQLYCFNFNTLSAKINNSGMDPNSFILQISQQIALKFQDDQRDRHHACYQLRKCLQSTIMQSLGHQFKMQDLKTVEQFQKKNYKPVVQFVEHCQTGDILLFQGSHFWAKVQRFVTNSDYDHVGMVYKDPIHGILIFESNSYSGICLTPWEYVLKYKWYTFIDKIVWRKLEGVQRDYAFVSELQEIIMEKVGKAYHISFAKLLTDNSYIYKRSARSTSSTEDKKQQQQKNNTKKQEDVGYFCSELVAAVYKDLKLLTRDTKNPHFKPSCNYYPYHWSQKFDPHLLKGKLSQQFAIHFDQKAIEEYYQF